MLINNCIILCGGKGTRLREFNSKDQKCLININNKPFLEYLLKQFSEYKITLCTGHLSEQVENYYRADNNITISKENTPLDTGGAIINSLNHINSEIIIISNGDSFCKFDLNEANKLFLEKDLDLLIITTDVYEDSGDYGVVNVDDTNRITSFNERPSDNFSSSLMNCGIYIAKKKIFDNFETEKISFEKEIIPILIKNYKCYSHNVHAKVYDIGTPDRIKVAEDFFRSL